MYVVDLEQDIVLLQLLIKNDYIRVFAGVGDWYIVQVEGDYVGAVNKKICKTNIS